MFQVNRDFGSIFGMLLPGTQAKLQPPEGQDVLDGLEVGLSVANKYLICKILVSFVLNCIT